HGYGVRVAFRGHDMHGLILGPDGRLYFSIGDRGYNVVNQEGERLKEPGRGAVFRCELDGSKLEVFARGLRNPQELAFDDYGNLFTGDNNCDAGDAARLVYLMEGADSGWSMNFQYLPDRGPWMSESWWKPPFEGQPAFLNPPLRNMTAGPSGFTHYPGVGLPPEMDDSFFISDFRGGANYSGVYRFQLEPDGAGFTIPEPEEFWWGVLVTDVDFGPDCSLYLTDWVSGWVGPNKGRVYRLDYDDLSKSALVLDTKRILGEGMAGRQLAELLALMQHPDYRIRLRAQLACMEQGGAAISGLIELARSEGAVKPRLHAIWALSRLDQGEALAALLTDGEAEVRAQAAKGLGECSLDASDALIACLQDENPRVRFFACQALGERKVRKAIEPIFQVLEENQDRDRFLRHAASLALARIGDRQALLAVQDRSRSVRLGAVLALRHLRDGSLITFLQDPDRFVATEAAIAIYDLDLTAAFPPLVQAMLVAEDVMPRAFARRALHASNRMGAMTALVQVAVDSEYDPALREEVAKMIGDWMEPAEFDALLNESRTYAVRSQASAARVLDAHLGSLLNCDLDAVPLAAIRLVESSEYPKAGSVLLRKLSDGDASVPVRVACLDALGRIGSEELSIALNLISEFDVPQLRDKALEILASRSPDQALPVLAKLLEVSTPGQKAHVYSILSAMNLDAADEILAASMGEMFQGNVERSIQVELLEAVEARAAQGSRNMIQLLASWRASRKSMDPVAQLAFCLEGGNAEAGRKVFLENATASCLRCHTVDGEGGDALPAEVGPNLSGVGLRLDRQELLTAIVQPAATIASGFEIYGDGGQLIPASAMLPNLGSLLTPREIRDLVEYLTTLRKPSKIWVFVHSAGYEHEVAKADEEGL
ncbi:MAG: HEAT repeat domain-containing protein, partial [Planctomycetes bacterium]|nr:HEAT repeat domain-containing protein [Planctomycetota bacterium]